MAKWPELPKAMEKEVYAPLRCTEGRYWLDSTCIRTLPEMVREDVQRTQEEIPTWDKVNPVVMIAKCRLEWIDRA